MRSPNIKPDAPNPAIAPRFHIDHDRRRVGDPERSAMNWACPADQTTNEREFTRMSGDAYRFCSGFRSPRKLGHSCRFVFIRG